jgi:hypothetical protein
MKQKRMEVPIMKKAFTPIAMLAVLLTVAFLLFGCEGPQGPAGKNGQDGINNVFNLEGFAPNIKCATCHTADQDTTYYVAGRKYEWSSSKHAIGGDIDRNTTLCAGCHTTEGFVKRAQAGWTSQLVPSDILHPSPLGCFSCHSPHARNDFSLRQAAPVTITSFVAGVPNAVFDYGKGNICVQCHQTRTSSPITPVPDPTKTAITDTIVIRSSRWYPHYGVNGQMLIGTGGFQFVDFTYSGNSNHTSNTAIRQDGCAKCHMSEPVGGGAGRAGGHTMWIGYTNTSGTTSYVVTGCRESGCHVQTMTTPDITGPSTGGVGAQTLINRNLDTLRQLLIARNWLDPVTDLVRASSSAPLRIAPASRSGALHNYFFVEHDGSKGVHNTKYAIELLRSSILELRKP